MACRCTRRSIRSAGRLQRCSHTAPLQPTFRRCQNPPICRRAQTRSRSGNVRRRGHILDIQAVSSSRLTFSPSLAYRLRCFPPAHVRMPTAAIHKNQLRRDLNRQHLTEELFALSAAICRIKADVPESLHRFSFRLTSYGSGAAITLFWHSPSSL